MLYTQFTRDQRIGLAALLHTTLSVTACAIQLGKTTGSVTREIGRNSCPDGIYRGGKAHKRAMARRKEAKRPSRIIAHNGALEAHIHNALKAGQSPEQIAGRLKQRAGTSPVSYGTIYTWIYTERRELGACLRHKHTRHRRRHGTKHREDTRERSKVKRIDERPLEVALRTRIGDWEGDTVIGGERTTRIVTNVERYSGYGFADLLHTVTAETVREKIIARFSRLPRNKRYTYTYDNGKEIGLDDRDLEKKTGMDVYRAYPYHSWERGTNENWNGLLREYFPKQLPFATLTQADVDRAVKALNNRPRKRLGYLTPHEVFVLGMIPPGREGVAVQV